MPNLLLLCEYPTLAGGERSMLSILPTLRQHGYQLSVIAPQHGPLAERLNQLEVPIIAIDFFTAEGKRRSQAEIRCTLNEYLRKHQPDVVHANSLAMGRLSGPVCRDLKIPSVSHLRDIIKLSRQGIDDLNSHRRLIAVSHAVRNHHVAAGLSAEKTTVLYNGVDLQIFQPRKKTGYLHRELNIPSQSRLIAIIGQICLRKGLDVFCEIASTLSSQHDGLHFLVVGSRFSQKQESCDLEQQLIQLAMSELNGKLHLLGERTDADKILNELTLLLHTSRQEPLGRVLLEASAAGVPVVATDVGGTCEIFPATSAAARITPVDQPQLMVAEVNDLLRHPQKQKEISHNARNNALERFDYQNSAEGLLTIYREILSR